MLWRIVGVELELELELIQPHMAQKPVLRGGARALRVKSVSREEAWASADVQGAWVSGCGCEADWGVLSIVESEAFFVVVLPRRGCARHRTPHGSGIYWKQQFTMCLEAT